MDDNKEERICRLESCGKSFLAKVHNQSFHEKECCRIFTNARILKQYHEKRKQKLEGRVCKTKNCNTLLSIYNDTPFCALCDHKQNIERWESWGWRIVSE